MTSSTLISLRQTGINAEELVSAIFTALDPEEHEIRLVLLEPSLDLDAPVCCKLKVARLGSNPAFQALSWAWGDSTHTQEIFLNGHRWHTPANLVPGLMCLRSREFTKVFWIDALCIDPSKTHAARSERGHQVRMMRQIYSRASNVVIWMGMPSEGLGYFLLTSVLGGRNLVEAFAADKEATILGLLKMLELPWWQRLWVLQEAILPLMVSIHFGSEAIPFWYLLDDLDTFKRHLTRKTVGYPNEVYLSWERLRDAFEASVDIFWKIGRNPRDMYRPLEGPCATLSNSLITPATSREQFDQFSSYIANCRYQLTSEPRDKVFALVGLVDDAVALEIEPDYNESLEKSFIRTTKLLIEASRSMYLLTQAFPNIVSMSIKDRPSWVPDWTMPQGIIAKLSAEKDRTQSRWNLHFSACNGELRFLQQGDTGESILRCDGICIDQVACRSRPFRRWWTFEGWLESVALWENFLQDNIEEAGAQLRGFARMSTLPTTLQDVLVLIYLLHPTQLRIAPPSVHKVPHAFRSDPVQIFFLTVLQGMDVPKERLDDLPMSNAQRRAEQRANGSYDILPERPFHFSRVRPVHELLEDMVLDRCLFITEDRMYGNGPLTMEPGDQIFVLAGGNIPLVLRPVIGSPGTYTYIGECYLYDIMNGQAVTEEALSMKWRRSRTAPSGPAHVERWESVYLA